MSWWREGGQINLRPAPVVKKIVYGRQEWSIMNERITQYSRIQIAFRLLKITVTNIKVYTVRLYKLEKREKQPYKC